MARYTDEFRAYAVNLLEMEGYPKSKGALVRAAKALKISHQILHRWYHHINNPPPQKVVQITKEQLIELLQQQIYGALTEMENAKQDAEYKDLAVGAAVMIDKLQLLQGQPTEILAHELTDRERASEIQALVDTARERAARLPPLVQ